MPDIQENINLPQYTEEDLNILQDKIEKNLATVQDYQQLQDLISARGLPNYFLNEMKRFNIYSFEHFINERKKANTDPTKISGVDGTLVGIFLGIIDAIRRSYL